MFGIEDAPEAEGLETIMKQFILNWVKASVLIILITSCTNRAYKVVAVDPDPSIRNKKLLLSAYNRSFPQNRSPKIKSDTTQTVSHDTATNNSVETTKDLINKYILEHPCSIDTSAIAAIIKAGIKPDVIIKRIETKIRDSVPWEDMERLNNLQLKYDHELSENESLRIENATLKYKVKDLQDDNRKLKFKQWMGWIVAASIIALWLLRIYLKLKTKII